MDSNYNPRMKDDFVRDEFVKQLDPSASEAQSEKILRLKKKQMDEGHSESKFKPQSTYQSSQRKSSPLTS